MELINLENVRQTLEEYANEVRNLYQDNLITNDRISSGGLLNGVEYIVEQNGQEYSVSLELNKYWKYIEYGVQGKKNTKSPYKNPGWKAFPAIMDWIMVKPVLPRPFDNGKMPKPKQLAYLITSKIVENGTEAGEELQDALDVINEKYQNKLVYALQADAENILKVIVGDFQGSINTE